MGDYNEEEENNEEFPPDEEQPNAEDHPTEEEQEEQPNAEDHPTEEEQKEQAEAEDEDEKMLGEKDAEEAEGQNDVAESAENAEEANPDDKIGEEENEDQTDYPASTENKESPQEQVEKNEEGQKNTWFHGMGETETKEAEEAHEEEEEAEGQVEEAQGDAMGGATERWEGGKGQTEERKKHNLQDMNPERNLGDVLKKWRERLELVEEEVGATNDLKDDNAMEEDPGEGQTFAHAPEDAETEEQALADAMDEDNVADGLVKPPDEDEMPADKMESQTSDPKGAGGSDKGKQKERAENKFDEPQTMEADKATDEIVEEEMDQAPTVPENPPEQLFPDTMPEPFGPEDDEIDDKDLREITHEELDNLRKELDLALLNQKDDPEGLRLWATLSLVTTRLSQQLCEQLRTILEPLLCTKFRGDYRTGKRINMKKVIPYIASQFQKDKIWLRRTKPFKRNYQVLIAIDDSESMKDLGHGRLALEAMATLARALTRLEIGEIGVVSFGERSRLLHPLDQPFTDAAGARVVSQFTFRQGKTHWDELFSTLLPILIRRGFQKSGESLGLIFVISDARIQSDAAALRKWVRLAQERKHVILLIIVDDVNPKNSILSMKQVSFVDGKPHFKEYMKDFPFPFFAIIRDIQTLPSCVASSLRQWFQIIAAA